MDCLALMSLAEREGIKVIRWDFAPPIKGLYHREPGMPPVIGLSHSIANNLPVYKSIFAEELGHHMTSVDKGLRATCFHYQDRLAVSKCEYKALRWAAQYLIKLPRIVQAWEEGCVTYRELAAYLQVTEELARHRMAMVDAIEAFYNRDKYCSQII